MNEPIALYAIQENGSLLPRIFSIPGNMKIPPRQEIERIAQSQARKLTQMYGGIWVIKYISHEPKPFKRASERARNAIDIEILTGPDTPTKQFLLRVAKKKPASRTGKLVAELNIDLSEVRELPEDHIMS